MNTILAKIETGLRNNSLNDLYKFSTNIQTNAQLLQNYYVGQSNIIDLSFLSTLSPNDKSSLVDFIMRNKEVYWVLRQILQNGINQGSLNLNDFNQDNLKQIIESIPFTKSIIKALSDKKITLNNNNSFKNRKINSQMSNELNSINLEPHTVLPLIQNVLGTSLPQNAETLVYDSLLHDLSIVLKYNKGLLGSKSNVISQVLSNFGKFLNQINDRITRIIQTKSLGQSGGSQLIHRLANMPKSKLKTIESQIGSAKMKRMIKKCGCEKDIQTINNKLYHFK